MTLKQKTSHSRKTLLEKKYDATDTYIWRLPDGGWTSGDMPDSEDIDMSTIYRLNTNGEDALNRWLECKMPGARVYCKLDDISDEEMWDILTDPQFNYFVKDDMPIELNENNSAKENIIMEMKNFSRMVDRIISESLREAYEEFLAEQRMNDHVDRIINESIRKIVLNEGKDRKRREDKDKNARRTEVYKDLKKDGVNTAQYAYKLYPNKDEASARGLFMKKLNHDLNDNGYPYQFNSKEINRLYSMLSNGTLS